MPSVFRLTYLDEEILKMFDIDTRPVMMRLPDKPTRLCSEKGAFYDDYGILWREVKHESGIYTEMVETPLAEATIDEIDSYTYWPDTKDPARYAGMEEEARLLYENTDYAIIAMPAFNSIWEKSWNLRGLERMMLDMVDNPDFVHALMRKLTDLSKACLEKHLAAVGKYAYIIRMGDDLASQNSLLVSPRMYRKFIKPYQKELFDFIHARTEAKIWFHSCGSIVKLIPDLIEIGVDLLNPVQVSAKDMDTAYLKQAFGDRLAFCGAIDTQHVLPHGTIADVKKEVERRIRDLAPGGGYLLTSVHNIQDDVPPENVIAMFQHAKLVGKYPISIND
jgi:uroporphyrinogen decarboxylase